VSNNVEISNPYCYERTSRDTQSTVSIHSFLHGSFDDDTVMTTVTDTMACNLQDKEYFNVLSYVYLPILQKLATVSVTLASLGDRMRNPLVRTGNVPNFVSDHLNCYVLVCNFMPYEENLCNLRRRSCKHVVRN
jgi:hypothetical protein